MTLTPYELERQARLEENAKLLASLGLDAVHGPRGGERKKGEGTGSGTRHKKVRVDTPDRALRPRVWRSSPSSSSEPPSPCTTTRNKGDRAVVTTTITTTRHPRVYDPVLGTSCHQCRQKTTDAKRTCTLPNCFLKICFRCLPNRYGTSVHRDRDDGDDDWQCPKCRGLCNCSLCRKASGRAPTGILAPVAFKLGFDGVAAMLASTERAPYSVSREPTKKKRKRGQEEDEDEREYIVESIVAATLVDGDLFFQTRWAGYAAEEDTMEPYRTMYNLVAMDAYEAAGGTVEYQGISVPVGSALAWRAISARLMRREFAEQVRRSQTHLHSAPTDGQVVKVPPVNAAVAVA
ncbi:protein of unknown function [Taphrina deformans PYCC 5710]|uniref:Chromo domain-containing protein n=1 Tax=Taphrina deformans (strain PYCC 5710 / ATCC 11124 / CBS 356.35 / IMI 108563 / JCM 9778 / NBRC 8474) TaxID=1097556 RepID=R4X7E6_TAPDE|nr:protein of unknown function [Taphrina deformans PYCC 5710]|eukprot:CCG81269.1 protein of unknown function [Taphrina deformans PYCC 5710]